MSTLGNLDDLSPWQDFAGQSQRVLVISGPTGVGKSAIAEALAAELGGNAEIVSADSVQVYRGMDIGSNKPTKEEQQAVRYHLVDVKDPVEEYSAADFADASATVISEIHARGHLPIVVGGTGFYIQWLLFGRPEAPPPTAEAASKAKAEVEALNGEWERGLARGLEVDPDYAQSLCRNDWFRLQRMLEVAYTPGGGKLSEFERRHGKQLTAGEAAEQLRQSKTDFRCFFVHKRRVELFRDIDLRCEQMLRRGFLLEVWRLVQSGQLAVAAKGERSSERAIGYRQALDYLHAVRGAVKTGDVSSAEHDAMLLSFIDAFQAASRQFVRRQLLWFRNDPLFRWVHAADRAAAKTQIGEELRMPQDRFLGLYGDEAEAKGQAAARESESGKEAQRELKTYRTQQQIYASAESRRELVDALAEAGVLAALAAD